MGLNAKQVEQLDKLVAESGGKRVRVRQVAAKVKSANGEKSSDAPSRKEIKRVLEGIESIGTPEMADVVAWGARAAADALAWALTGARGGHFGAWLDARERGAAAVPAKKVATA